MKVRFCTFTKLLSVTKCEGEHTTRVRFQVPHRVMLQNLSQEELLSIQQQLNKLLSAPKQEERTIYLGSVECVEEVTNEQEVLKDEESQDEEDIDE